jgi:hypothetical protein
MGRRYKSAFPAYKVHEHLSLGTEVPAMRTLLLAVLSHSKKRAPPRLFPIKTTQNPRPAPHEKSATSPRKIRDPTQPGKMQSP